MIRNKQHCPKIIFLFFLLFLCIDENVLGQVNAVVCDTLNKTDNWGEVYEHSLSLCQKQDSLFANNNQQWYERHGSVFDLLDKEKMIVKYNEQSDICNNICVCSLALLCVIIFIIIQSQYHIRKQRQVNEKICDSILVNENTCEQLRSIEKELCRLKTTVTPSPVVTMEADENELFCKIEAMMQERKLFLQSDFKQEYLLNELHISAKELKCVLLSKTGLTFNEYLLSLRLRHARQLLLDTNRISVEKIAYSSGFNSRRTFYRAFQEAYAMSPLEYKHVTR